MRVLITGGEGYIGTNLSDFLTRKGYDVEIMDRKSSGWAETVSSYYMEWNIHPHAIVHLAALSGIKQCNRDISLAINDNIMTAENIFSISDRLNIPVIFTSSQAAKNPQNIYGVLKCVCEKLAQKYNVSILRLSNVYGGIDYLTTKTSAIANFINAKINNKQIVINGDGNQTRDFIHVSEVCRAIELCLGKYNLLLDIGTGIPRSINEVVQMMNYDNIINTRGPGDVSSGTADTSKAKDIIGFEAVDMLREYLKAPHRS